MTAKQSSLEDASSDKNLEATENVQWPIVWPTNSLKRKIKTLFWGNAAFPWYVFV